MAHGATPEKPTVEMALTTWRFDPLLVLGLLAAAGLYLWGVWRVQKANPRIPFPAYRIASFLAGLLVITVALQSAIDTYDTTLFSVHMAQHLLLTMVAAPLLVLGTPITLALRAASPRVRRRYLLPVLHSPIVRTLSHPVVAGLVFVGTIVAWHISDLYNEAVESEVVHYAQHANFLGTALLFWWPMLGQDPSRWVFAYPLRILVLLLAVPFNSILGVMLLNTDHVIYSHYETLARDWGPSPISDQQAGAALMWIGGSMMYGAALAAVGALWWHHEKAAAARTDAALDRDTLSETRTNGATALGGRAYRGL
jgi:putative copper resistance protein D